MGYTKLFQEIIMSTVWREPNHVRILWITMLALKDRSHVVSASLPGLADSAKITLEECEKALKVLSEPDPYSRTKDFEGRRIEPCDGGWVILNGEKYRNKMSRDERNEYQRIKQQEYRNRRKKEKNRLQSSLQNCQLFTHTDTDTDTDTDTETSNNKKPHNHGGISFEKLPPSISIEAAIEYIDHRKLIKKPLTQNAFDRAMDIADQASYHPELVKMGITPDRVVTETVDAGWAGVNLKWIVNRLSANDRMGNKNQQEAKGDIYSKAKK